MIQEIPSRCLKVQGQDSFVFEEEAEDDLLFNDNKSNIDDDVDSNDATINAMAEEVNLLDSTRIKTDSTLLENDKDINFNLIKESKAFKTKKKTLKKNRNNEDISYVINKTLPGASEQGQQSKHHTPHRISQEDQDAWFTQ